MTTASSDSGSKAVQVGVLLPHADIGDDPGGVRAWAQAVEETGYTHVLAYEHVLGAGTQTRPDWSGPYTWENPFHEPLILFAFMAAATERLGFVTGIFVLPQRQTALVAKQAAELAIVSGGRFRLGVGIGWNEVEFEALGVPFERRGARFEEQLVLLRRLWADPLVTFEGEFHTVIDAGINPRPTGGVPLWLGSGSAPVALDRVARLADGWVPAARTAVAAAPMLEELAQACERHGRDIASLGIEARLILRDIPRDAWADELAAWVAAGATHVSLSVAGLGLQGIDDQLRFLESFADDHIGSVGR